MGEGSGAGCYEEVVDVAVVTTIELDDFVAAGESACETDGGHGGFGARVGHADFLY